MPDTNANTNPTPKPAGITCRSYQSGEGKRCVFYLEGGDCKQSSNDKCIEWLRVNRHHKDCSAQKATGAAVGTDLFGNPLPPPKPKRKIKLKQTHQYLSERDTALEPEPLPAPVGIRLEDIESFKALGVEIGLKSDVYGELWLVPSYSKKPRKEITPEHAALLCQLIQVFPGADVIAFEKKPANTKGE